MEASSFPASFTKHRYPFSETLLSKRENFPVWIKCYASPLSTKNATGTLLCQADFRTRKWSLLQVSCSREREIPVIEAGHVVVSSELDRAICTSPGRIPVCASQVISTSSPFRDLFITNCLIIWTWILNIIYMKTRPSLFLELLADLVAVGLSILYQLCFTGIVPEAYVRKELPNVVGLIPVQYLVNSMVTMLHYCMFLAGLVFIHSFSSEQAYGKWRCSTSLDIGQITLVNLWSIL